MKLGDAWQVTIGVRSLDASLVFYLKLGFQIVGRDTKPSPWVQLTDGCMLVLLTEDGKEYAGITYFSSDAERRVESLQKSGFDVQRWNFQNGDWFQAALYDPDGFGMTFVGFDGTKIHKPEGKPLTRCGRLAELSIEVSDFHASTKFWTKLGFNLHMFKENQRWGR